MSLKRDIVNFIDGYELVCPTRVGPKTMRSSDNGVLHSSRYLILLKLNGETNDATTLQGIKNCIDRNGYLHRSPGDETEEAPDDHYGAISVFSFLNDTTYIKLPWRVMHPMLIYMRALQLGGLQGLIARLFSPILALVIVFSNFNTPKNDTSNRLLTWNIIQGTRERSIFCRLAGQLWYSRQNHIYGSQALQEMFNIYYSENPMKDYVKE
jgi:hypothetical protein